MSEFNDPSPELPYSFWRVLTAAVLIGGTLLALLVYT